MSRAGVCTEVLARFEGALSGLMNSWVRDLVDTEYSYVHDPANAGEDANLITSALESSTGENESFNPRTNGLDANAWLMAKAIRETRNEAAITALGEQMIEFILSFPEPILGEGMR